MVRLGGTSASDQGSFVWVEVRWLRGFSSIFSVFRLANGVSYDSYDTSFVVTNCLYAHCIFRDPGIVTEERSRAFVSEIKGPMVSVVGSRSRSKCVEA